MNSFHALRGFREYLIYSQISRLRDLLEVTPITTNCGKCQKSSYNFLRIIFWARVELLMRIEHIWKWLPNSDFAFSLKSYWVVNHPLLGDLTYLKSAMKRSVKRNMNLIYSRVSNNRPFFTKMSHSTHILSIQINTKSLELVIIYQTSIQQHQSVLICKQYEKDFSFMLKMLSVSGY